MVKTRKQNKTLRALVMLLVVALALCLLPADTHAETAKEKYERLKEELNQIGTALEDAKGKKAAAEEQLAKLQQEQAVLQELIALNEEDIEQTQGELDAKQNEVAKIRAELYNNDQLYQRRLIAIYKMNNASVLSQVLSLDSFTELFQVVDAMSRISKNDTELLAEQSQIKSHLEGQEAQIQSEIDNLMIVHEELAVNNQRLVDNQAAQQSILSGAEADIATGEDAYKDKYAALIQAQNEMIAIENATRGMGTQRGDGSEYVGGVFVWPVPSSFNISCYFGSPDPNGNPHRGMDIHTSGQIGPPIVACGAGTVIVANYAHSSYGNYLVIDHGDGLKTLYAHCNTLNKNVGDIVMAGEQIATVGSTGFSTGPHLHLEVQHGGLQNPLNYLR